MVSPGRLVFILLLSAMVLGSIGCRRGDLPELGRVRGTITLDAKPLSGVVVMFLPDKGRPAVANTDSEGRYDLTYVHGVQGANVGPNTVRIVWPDGEPGSAAIPAKYGAQSDLKVDVKSGDNTFDFPMESK